MSARLNARKQRAGGRVTETVAVMMIAARRQRRLREMPDKWPRYVASDANVDIVENCRPVPRCAPPRVTRKRVRRCLRGGSHIVLGNNRP